MQENNAVIGLSQEEVEWVRLLVSLLRHAEPGTAELCRQALLYVDARDHLGAASSKSGAL